MMTLNNNEKDFQEKLQKDTEMPAIVHERINQAYRLIENNAVLQKKAPKDPYHWMKIGGRVAGGMAAVLAVGFIFCATNPVMAKNIPVVGGLFEQPWNPLMEQRQMAVKQMGTRQVMPLVRMLTLKQQMG